MGESAFELAQRAKQTSRMYIIRVFTVQKNNVAHEPLDRLCQGPMHNSSLDELTLARARKTALAMGSLRCAVHTVWALTVTCVYEIPVFRCNPRRTHRRVLAFRYPPYMWVTCLAKLHSLYCLNFFRPWEWSHRPKS